MICTKPPGVGTGSGLTRGASGWPVRHGIGRAQRLAGCHVSRTSRLVGHHRGTGPLDHADARPPPLGFDPARQDRRHRPPGVGDRARGQRSRATVAEALRLTGAVLRSAVRNRLIPFNPADEVRVPRSRPRDSDERIISRSDLRARLLPAVPPRHRAVVATAAGAGLRWGEAVGLRTAALDLPGASSSSEPSSRSAGTPRSSHTRSRRSGGGPCRCRRGSSTSSGSTSEGGRRRAIS
jgi:hypothetical protein